MGCVTLVALSLSPHLPLTAAPTQPQRLAPSATVVPSILPVSSPSLHTTGVPQFLNLLNLLPLPPLLNLLKVISSRPQNPSRPVHMLAALLQVPPRGQALRLLAIPVKGSQASQELTRPQRSPRRRTAYEMVGRWGSSGLCTWCTLCRAAPAIVCAVVLALTAVVPALTAVVRVANDPPVWPNWARRAGFWEHWRKFDAAVSAHSRIISRWPAGDLLASLRKFPDVIVLALDHHDAIRLVPENNGQPASNVHNGHLIPEDTLKYLFAGERER
ncbi:hypothetical protein C8F01DRAFT_1247974 [Mycena amicta]|nr:hypothetical protein C8F01DRAFT_1247974 [Mycena amicta]